MLVSVPLVPLEDGIIAAFHEIALDNLDRCFRCEYTSGHNDFTFASATVTRRRADTIVRLIIPILPAIWLWLRPKLLRLRTSLSRSLRDLLAVIRSFTEAYTKSITAFYTVQLYRWRFSFSPR